MPKVSAPEQVKQVASPNGVAGSCAVDRPPKRSGRGGAEGLEPRVAGGLTPQNTLTVPGLVPSPKTARVVPLTLGSDFWAAVTRCREDVVSAARAFGESPWPMDAEESPLPRLKVSFGSLVLTRTSVAQEVRAGELAHMRQVAKVNVAGQFLAENLDWQWKQVPGREITEWSYKSRLNMVRTLASLDWTPLLEQQKQGRVPAYVTLTYPGGGRGDWLTVAPDGKTVKRQLRAFQLRYRRAWGEPIVAPWKFEFQEREAPHFHMFMCPPHGLARGRGVGAGLSFMHWLSAVWADVVNDPDPVRYMDHLKVGTQVDYKEALKCKDPKSISTYFGKHGQFASKEYQHIVPEAWREPGKGPGRFWGYWGLKPLVVAVEMTPDDYKLAARIMRRYAERTRVWDRSAGEWVTTRTMRPGKGRYKVIDYETGEIIWRKHRRRSRVRRFSNGSGFQVVNDGPALANQLARAIKVCRK
jgi:hypothetical protein